MIAPRGGAAIGMADAGTGFCRATGGGADAAAAFAAAAARVCTSAGGVAVAVLPPGVGARPAGRLTGARAGAGVGAAAGLAELDCSPRISAPKSAADIVLLATSPGGSQLVSRDGDLPGAPLVLAPVGALGAAPLPLAGAALGCSSNRMSSGVGARPPGALLPTLTWPKLNGS